MVLLRDDNLSRCEWPIGRVLEVYKGRDDLVRSVLIKTSKGNYKRPITKVILLECQDEYEENKT